MGFGFCDVIAKRCIGLKTFMSVKLYDIKTYFLTVCKASSGSQIFQWSTSESLSHWFELAPVMNGGGKLCMNSWTTQKNLVLLPVNMQVIKYSFQTSAQLTSCSLTHAAYWCRDQAFFTTARTFKHNWHFCFGYCDSNKTCFK